MSRAPIDRLISRESSASPDLVDDRAAHPVCDHSSQMLIAASHSCGLGSISTLPQWQAVNLLQSERLGMALVDSVSVRPLPLAVAARQQRWHGTKMINSD